MLLDRLDVLLSFKPCRSSISCAYIVHISEYNWFCEFWLSQSNLGILWLPFGCSDDASQAHSGYSSTSPQLCCFHSYGELSALSRPYNLCLRRGRVGYAAAVVYASGWGLWICDCVKWNLWLCFMTIFYLFPDCCYNYVQYWFVYCITVDFVVLLLSYCEVS